MNDFLRRPDGQVEVSGSVDFRDVSSSQVDAPRADTVVDVNSVEGLAEKVDTILSLARKYPKNKDFENFIGDFDLNLSNASNLSWQLALLGKMADLIERDILFRRANYVKRNLDDVGLLNPYDLFTIDELLVVQKLASLQQNYLKNKSSLDVSQLESIRAEFDAEFRKSSLSDFLRVYCRLNFALY